MTHNPSTLLENFTTEPHLPILPKTSSKFVKIDHEKNSKFPDLAETNFDSNLTQNVQNGVLQPKHNFRRYTNIRQVK